MNTLVLLLLLICSSVWATPFGEWPCSQFISKQAQEWKASESWEKHSIGGNAQTFYAATTPSVGDWVLVRKSAKGVAIARANQLGRIEVSFEGKDCIKKIIPYAGQKNSPDTFTDKELKSFILKHEAGVIYVWSPRMGLSEMGIKEIQKAAKSLKLPVLVLMNKDVSIEEHAKLASKLGKNVTQKVDSFEFKMRNVDQHFPAVMTFNKGQINSGIKYGYEKSEIYSSDITKLLSK